MRNLSTPRIRFSALCLGAALLLGTPAVAQDPWLRQDPNFQYQSVQGGQRHFPFDDSFKMPQNMTPYEHEAYNQGANVQALRGLNEGQFQALRGYLTALGSQVANERLQGHITAQNSGIFARPDQAVVNAWDSIRNTRGLDGRIGASPGDMKLVAQYMQTNDELRRIHAAVYGRPDVAGAADAARARASGMDMAGENSAASKGRLLRDFVAPGGREPTDSEVRGLGAWKQYFEGRVQTGESSVAGLLNRPEMKMGANYLFSRGDVVPQNTNPSQWNWNNLDASRQGAQMDWRRVGARLDARCDARTEQEKREDPLPDPDRRRPEQKSSSSIKEEAPVPK